MTIAKVTDTGPEILLACSLASADDVAAPAVGSAGTVNGTATFTNGGMNPGSAGSITFSAFDTYTSLKHEGQIVVTVTTEHISIPDNTASVSGSEGEAKSASGYLWTLRDSVPANQGYLNVSSAEALVGKLHTSDTQSSALAVTTAGKDEFSEVCVSWKGTEGLILVNGGFFQSFTRANFADVFASIRIGAGFDGVSTPNSNAIFKNIVISRKAVRFHQRYDRLSIGIFGNSFVSRADSAGGTPRYDNRGDGLLNRYFASQGWVCNRIVWSGFAGYTTGDDTLNLSGEIDAFVQTRPHVAVLMSAENDTTNATARLTTDANYKAFILKIMGKTAISGVYYTQCKKTIVCNPGSLMQYASLYTAENIAGHAEVGAIINALPAWWDALYPAEAGKVVVFDLHAALGGDSEGNLNYQGALNAIGNAAGGGSATPVTPNDRHPSSLGNKVLFDALASMI